MARKLTEVEIDRLVTVIPDVPPNTKFPEAVRLAQTQLRERLRFQLRKIMLVPAKLDELYLEIKRQYDVSIVQPGKAVGIDMSQSFGESSTQSTLNTFHLSGVASNVTGGIQGFKELINAREKRLFESTVVHFRSDQLTMSDIISLRGDIAHLSASDLVLDYETVSAIDYFDDGYPAAYPYWYQVYVEWHPELKELMLTREDDDQLVPLISYFLRLTIDVDTMYARGITMEEVCRKITLNSREKKKSGGSPNPTVFCIPSPINLGIVDVYPIAHLISLDKVNFSALGDDPARMRSATEEAYISAAIYPSLGEITMRGIKGIEDLVPTHYKIIQSKRRERFLNYQSVTAIATSGLAPDSPASSSSSSGGAIRVRKRWEMMIDARVYRTTSLTVGKMIALLVEVGMTVESLTIDPSMYEEFNTELYPPAAVELMVGGGTRSILRENRTRVNLAMGDLTESQTHLADQIQRRLGEAEIVSQRVPDTGSIVGVSLFKLTVLMPEENEEDPVNRLHSSLVEMQKTGKATLNHLQITLMSEFLSSYVTGVTVVGNKWRLNFDPGWLTVRTSESDFRDILKTFDMRYTIAPDHLDVEFIGLSPSITINQALTLDRKAEEKARDEGKIKPPSRLKSLSRYYNAFTKGTNLAELLKQPTVNPNFTYANNMYYNVIVFGIEMTRMFLVQEFINVLEASKSSLNIQHILLLVDYMTRAGNITKVSANGVINRDTGTLAKTSVIRAMEVFFRAGAFGARDVGLKEVSSSIMVGKRVQTGTGYGEYPTYQAALERLREAQRTGSHLMDQAEVDIDGLVGIDGLTPEGLEGSIDSISWSHNGLDDELTGGDAVQLPAVGERFDPSAIMEQLDTIHVHSAITPAPDISDHVSSIIDSLQQAPCIRKTVNRVTVEPTFNFDRTVIQRMVQTDTDVVEITIQLPQPVARGLTLPERIADDIERTLNRTIPVDVRSVPSVDATAAVTTTRGVLSDVQTMSSVVSGLATTEVSLPTMELPVHANQVTLPFVSTEPGVVSGLPADIILPTVSTTGRIETPPNGVALAGPVPGGSVSSGVTFTVPGAMPTVGTSLDQPGRGFMSLLNPQ